MKKRTLSLSLVALLCAVPVLAQVAPPGPSNPGLPSPGEIVAGAPAGDWVTIASADLLVMELAPDAKGNARRVVIQLMPAPFSQGWVGNIRTLAAAKFWDGTSINRVQDNYVVQWGDGEAEDKAKAKPVPEGLAVMTQSDYTTDARSLNSPQLAKAIGGGQSVQEMLGKMAGVSIKLQSEAKTDDPYAPYTGFVQGWPIASDLSRAWPTHCYGMIGVGRDFPPNTGNGAELYTVIGHAPRHLDRNIALVGRIVSGMEHLSSLPRGTGDLGFYLTAAERTPIVSMRIASDMAVADQPRFEYLSTESASFAAYADARRNRRDTFFIVPAGGADICNVPVPVRKIAE